MQRDDIYMQRCIQLAKNGKGRVSPNPMVGAVIVFEDKIIGEGYHRLYGNAHAEVNAINSVKDKSLLIKSTIYVSLEPCSHYGKTPPCAQLIIDSKIPKVIIATSDPFPEVSGRGIRMLREAGIEVVVGVLEKEARSLNKTFLTYNLKKRPYVYLKWAQSKDGFIDIDREDYSETKAFVISNKLTQILVHKLRSEVDSILVGTNTAVKDNPSLSTRLYVGKSPVRLILDKSRRVPLNYKIFDNSILTFIFTEGIDREISRDNVTYVPLSFNKNMIQELFKFLYERKIQSIMIEGGSEILQYFIDCGAWDEAYIETSSFSLNKGVKAPSLLGTLQSFEDIGGSELRILKNG